MSDSVRDQSIVTGLPSVSNLFKSSWKTYTKSWKLYVLLVLLPLIATLIILGLAAAIIGTILAVSGGDITPGRVALMVPPGLVAIVGLIIVNTLSQVGFIKAIQANGDTNIRELIRSSWPLLWQFLILSFLVGITVFFGIALLIIPGIIFAVWFMFSSFILVNEGTTGRAAMRRSKYYVKGQFWGILGRLSLLILVLILFSSLLSSIDDPVISGLTQVIASFIINPFSLIYAYKLYQGAKASTASALT